MSSSNWEKKSWHNQSSPWRGGIGRGGRRGGWPSRPSAPTPPPIPAPPFGALIQTLHRRDLDDDSELFADATIGPHETIASYNWMDKSKTSSEATILIPGKPPRWTPVSSPSRLQEDSGEYFRDKNAARYPLHPMEPAVMACLDSSTGTTNDNNTLYDDIDVVACGSTLGNLLRFVRELDRPFRMLVEKVGRTVFLIRRENSPTELLQDVRGFGHTFPEANTTWEHDVRGSTSHQRIVRYGFGGLTFLVRFEADGYLDMAGGERSPVPSEGSMKEKRVETWRSRHLLQGRDAAKAQKTVSSQAVDALADALATDVRVSSSQPPKGASGPSKLCVVAGGSSVDQDSVLEMKTRSIKSRGVKDHLAEELPRMWVSRIPWFILAYHTFGLFETKDVEVTNVTDMVEQWEVEHQDDLRHLAAAIHRIVEMVGEAGDGKLELSHQEPGKLEVREQLPGVGDVLSEEAKWRWTGGLVGDRGETTSVSGAAAGKDREWPDELWLSDTGEEKDYTWCDEMCGYCGHCLF